MRSSGLRKRRHHHGSPRHAQAFSRLFPFLRAPHALRENVDLACLTSVCDAEQLYTDAVFVLDASPREAAASGSGAIDLHYMHKHS